MNNEEWTNPESALPEDGQPIFLKIESIIEAWYVPSSKSSKWITKDKLSNANSVLKGWKQREGDKNFNALSSGSDS